MEERESENENVRRKKKKIVKVSRKGPPAISWKNDDENDKLTSLTDDMFDLTFGDCAGNRVVMK